MKSKSLFILLILFSIVATAQNEPKAVRDDNRAIRAITNRVDKTGWFYFKPNQKLTNKELFTDLKEAFGLTVNDEMRVSKDELESNEKGRHQRLQQYYQGILVEDAEYFLHYTPKGYIDVASGKLVENLTLSNKAKLTETEALDKAIRDIGAVTYA